MYYQPVTGVAGYDVIVAGGGPAGCCAAIACARLGARTALLEQYGVLGGAMTVGCVPFPMNFFAKDRQVIRGIGWELIERLIKGGWANIHGVGLDKEASTRLDPIMTACQLDELMQEAGVSLWLGAKLATVTAAEGRVTEIGVATAEGLRKMAARVFIDATGDGNLSAWAGAAFEMGEVGTGDLQPGTQGFWMDGYGEIDAGQAETAYEKGKAEGMLLPGDYWCEGRSPASHIFTSHGLNINHVQMPALTTGAFTQAALEGHAIVGRMLRWAKEEMPGMSGLTGSALSPAPWARESRRILGDGYVTAQDYLDARTYADGICYSYYPIDVHKKQTDGDPRHVHLDHGKLSKEHVPSIPLSAMLAQGFDNLLTAGRCISGDRLAQSAYRVQATCMAMGEAAGTAAALAIRADSELRAVDIPIIRAQLGAQGAIVPN